MFIKWFRTRKQKWIDNMVWEIDKLVYQRSIANLADKIYISGKIDGLRLAIKILLRG